jgi:hypothetical protein
MKFYIGGHYPNGGMNPLSNMTLKDLFIKNGLDIVQNADDADFYIAYNFSSRDRKTIKKFTTRNRILFISEPKVVLPNNFKRRIRRKFGLIISDDIQNRDEYLQRGQYFLENMSTATYENKIPKAILVNANKISLMKNNNYGFRKRSARKLKFIDLYGYGWDLSLIDRLKILVIEIGNSIKNYRFINLRSVYDWITAVPKSNGPIKDKNEVMKRYKFSLIIENQDTYLSEKIFDSFFSGCIPIYIGPNLENYPIPKGLYIQSKKEIKSVEESFQAVNELDYEKWFQLLTAWLTDSKTIQYWGEDYVVAEMVKRIKVHSKI